MQTINRSVGHGVIWMVTARLIDRSIGVVSTLILARLLVPADFGLVAMATALGGILDLMGAFSFDMALIQKKDAEARHYNTVWTFNVLFGVGCGLVLLLLAYPAANFYKEPRLIEVIYVLSISYFINAFSNIGVVDFRKNLDFQKEFRITLLKRLGTFVVTVVAAFALRSYWALLIGMTVGRAYGVVLSYTMNNYRPRLTLSAASELFQFSKWLFLNNVLIFISNDACTFVIGRLFGATELGVYSISNEISNLPTTELVAPINRATFPGFSKMKARTEIAGLYLKLLGMIALLIVPVGVGIAAVAQPLVLAVLGAKWAAGIPLIQILAIHGAINATQGNNGMVWLALGKSRNLTINMGLFILTFFPLLYLLTSALGLVGIAYAYLIANVMTLPYGLYVTRTLLRFTASDFIRTIWRPLAAAAVMYFVVIGFIALIAPVPALLQLIAASVVGACVYVAVDLALWRWVGSPDGAEAFCLEAANAKRKSLFARSL